MTYLLLIICLLLPPVAHAGDTAARLEQVRQQRAEVQKLREQLEVRLGDLGRELRGVDESVVRARREERAAADKVHAVDSRIGALRERQGELRSTMRKLQAHMQQEAALAYRQSGSPALWLDMLVDAQVADIPHRQYLLARLVQQQQKDRAEYAATVSELSANESELREQREALERLRAVKQQRLDELKAARAAKRALWNRVKRDAGLKARRDAQLARQEKALKKLLEGVGSTLLSSDSGDDWTPMRRMKGKLDWPIRGRIVAAFHSATVPGRPSLAGVQLAPRNGGGQVKAIAAGQVKYADWFGGYGLMLIVDHGDGLMTVYAHNDALYRRAGDWVAEGDVLADPGSTGWVQDTRLYFEVRDKGRPSNPKRWCRKQG